MVKRHLDDTVDLQEMGSTLKRLDSAVTSQTPVDTADQLEAELYLKQVARTGRTGLPWDTVRGLFARRLRSAFDELVHMSNGSLMKENEPIVRGFSLDESSAANERRAKLSAALDSAAEAGRAKMTSPNSHVAEHRAKVAAFTENIATLADTLKNMDNAPFTIQRLAELLVEPDRHYKRFDKFYRAIEKNLFVVTTVTPDGLRPIEVRNTTPPPISTPNNQTIGPSMDSLQPDSKKTRLSTSCSLEISPTVTMMLTTSETENGIADQNGDKISPGAQNDGISGDETTDLVSDPKTTHENAQSPLPEYVELANNDDTSATCDNDQEMVLEETLLTTSQQVVVTSSEITAIGAADNSGTDEEVTSTDDGINQ